MITKKNFTLLLRNQKDLPPEDKNNFFLYSAEQVTYIEMKDLGLLS